MLKKFKNSLYLGYKIKQVQNESNESYFFLITQITKIMKRKRHIPPNFVKLSINVTIGHINNKKIGHVNEKIGHVNETIRNVNESIQYKELEGRKNYHVRG